MARQPFLISVERFLSAPEIRTYFRPESLDRYGRDLRMIAHDLWSLRKEGRIPTTNPERLSWEDLCELRLLWQTRPTRDGTPIDITTENKRIDVLNAFLGWVGNPVIEAAKKRRLYRRTTPPRKPIQSLTSEDVERLQSAAESVEGWRGSVARFLVAVLPATGLRPGEIRRARLCDLDVRRLVIFVAHPKGEARYAVPQEVPIVETVEQAIRDFLVERQTFLGNEEHEALIPFRKWDGTVCYWSAAMLRKLKTELQERSGIRFRGLKTFRATFVQQSIDALVAAGYKERAAAEVVMSASRHTKLDTVLKFYGSIRKEDAFRELRAAWRKARTAEVVRVR